MAYNSTLSSQNIESALKTVHEAITIEGGILNLTSESSSEDIFDAFGGEDAFGYIVTKLLSGSVSFDIQLSDSSSLKFGRIMTSQWLDLSQQSSNIIVLHILYIYQDSVVHDIFTVTDSGDSSASISLEQTVTPVGGSGNSMFYDIKLSDYLSSDYNHYPIDGAVLYLSQEVYNNINNLTPTAKIIRVLATCGVFFSTAITTDMTGNINQITFAPIPSFKTSGENNTNNIFCVEIDSNTPDETHSEPYKATVSMGKVITKSKIESVFTGNIASHTHDTEYEIAQLETDTATTILSPSLSLSGSGTKEDPYLIQSCSDYVLFLYQENMISFDEKVSNSEPVYFKITKNLDFNNHAIQLASSTYKDYFYNSIYVDGNGSIISNLDLKYHTDAFDDYNGTYIYGVWFLPFMINSVVHDINFYNILVNSVGYGKQSSNILATTIYNFISRITIDLVFDNRYNSVSDDINLSFWAPYAYANPNLFSGEISKIVERGLFCGLSIDYPLPPTKVGFAVYIPATHDVIYFTGSNVDAGSDNTTVDVGEIAPIVIADDDSGISRCHFFGIHNVLLANNISSDTYQIREVEYKQASDLNTEDFIEGVNNGKHGFSIVEGYDIPLILSKQISYVGYAKKNEVLMKDNIEVYIPTLDYHPATKKYVDENMGVKESAVLTKNNTDSYEPTSDYNPATKKYVDSAGFIDKIFLFIDTSNNLVRIQDSSSIYTINTTWQSVGASSEIPGYKKISIPNTHGAYNVIDKIYNYLLDCRIDTAQRRTSLDQYHIKVFLSGTEALHHTMSFNRTQETDDTVSIGGFYALVSNQMVVPSMIVVPWIEALKIIKSTNSYILADFTYIRFDPTR